MPVKVLPEDFSEKLETIIAEARNDGTVELPSGSVFLSRKVRIFDKHNLTILGNNTVIITMFDPMKGNRDACGAFDFSGCEWLCLRKIAFDTDNPVNSAGKILSMSSQDRTVDIRVYGDCVLDGNQTVFALNSMDAEGSPDYLISSYGKTEYKCLENGTVRLFLAENMPESLHLLPNGEQLCLRFGVGGFDVLNNAVMTFNNCNDTVLEDIEMLPSSGYAVVVFPRCRNFTLNRYRVACPENSSRLMASNVDAVHLLGLTGGLSMRNCYFEGLGDDALNIHSPAGTVIRIDTGKIVLENGRFLVSLEREWCRPGDILAVYDRHFRLKITVTARFSSGHFRSSSKLGIFLQTLLFMPEQIFAVVRCAIQEPEPFYCRLRTFIFPIVDFTESRFRQFFSHPILFVGMR